jgi:hypothetical protein
MIENTFNILRDKGCIQFSIDRVDNIPNMARFMVREAYDKEEYSVDGSIELDDLEYIANRILDAVRYQRMKQDKTKAEK